MSLVRRPSLGFLALLVLAAAAAPLLAPHDPTEMNKAATLGLPSRANLLGTDQFGRDILSRLLHGARIALAIGLGATLGAAPVGVPLGLWAGWRAERSTASRCGASTPCWRSLRSSWPWPSSL